MLAYFEYFHFGELRRRLFNTVLYLKGIF